MSQLPHSPEAEASVVGMLLAKPKVAANIVGTVLMPDHFHVTAMKVLYEQIVENYYADDPIDALVIAEACSKKLQRVWNCTESEVVKHVQGLASGQRQFAERKAKDHADVVKRHADLRSLLDLSATIQRQVAEEDIDPNKIAGDASQTAMQIATDSILTQEIVSFGDLGRRYIQHLKMTQAAAAHGIELGAYFDLDFIDDWTRGFQPTELLMAGGEPGVGKSAVWWKAGFNFAERQMKKPEDQRISTLILSLEMGEIPSSGRMAQTLTNMDGGRLREGSIDEADFKKLVTKWSEKKDLPLYVNHTSTLKSSQLRALLVEAIRLHNVGVVIIDHFRYFDMDQRLDTQLREEEEKVRFLKEDLAKDLNIAVICLAHTTKAIESQDKRPRLSHLRGSGQIAAHADFVSFVFRPFVYASRKAKEEGIVKETDAEMIWAKNRHGMTGTADFYFEPSRMRIEGSL